jgi:hypothetical protein
MAGTEKLAVVDLEKLVSMEAGHPDAPTPGASPSQIANTGQAGSPGPETPEAPR